MRMYKLDLKLHHLIVLSFTPHGRDQLGRDEPAMSMDNSGKIIWARHNEVQQVVVGKPDEEAKDGEPMVLSVKDLGSCEIYPQTLSHNPNGRYAATSHARGAIELHVSYWTYGASLFLSLF